MFQQHPVTQSIFIPILNALPAFGIGYLFGYACGRVAGLLYPEIPGIMGGSVCAILSYLVDRLVWLSILHNSYLPPTPYSNEVDDTDAYKIPQSDYIVSSADNMHVRYISPPISDYLLFRFCTGVLNGKRTSYDYWVRSEDAPFKQLEFQQFRNWLMDEGYAKEGEDRTLEFTADGVELMKDIAGGRLRAHPLS